MSRHRPVEVGNSFCSADVSARLYSYLRGLVGGLYLELVRAFIQGCAVKNKFTKEASAGTARVQLHELVLKFYISERLSSYVEVEPHDHKFTCYYMEVA